MNVYMLAVSTHISPVRLLIVVRGGFSLNHLRRLFPPPLLTVTSLCVLFPPLFKTKAFQLFIPHCFFVSLFIFCVLHFWLYHEVEFKVALEIEKLLFFAPFVFLVSSTFIQIQVMLW